MTRDEFKQRLNQIDFDYKQAKHKLLEDYTSTNKPRFTIGDIVRVKGFDRKHQVMYVNAVDDFGHYNYHVKAMDGSGYNFDVSEDLLSNIKQS